MKNHSWLLLFVILLFVGSNKMFAQSTDCPASMPVGTVCIPQATANKLFDTVNQLIAAKDLITKLTTERGTADATIASALRVIEDYKQLDVINGMMIAKYKDVVALYEQVIKLYQGMVDKLEARLNAPKSAWQKFVGVLKTAASILTGVAIGRLGVIR